MAHPLRGDTNASREAKLRAMTSSYGEADKKNMQYANVNKYKIEGPEAAIGFGADHSRPNKNAAKRIRKPAGGNAFATYKRGGRVKHRSAGGDTSDIEQANIDQKLESERKHGGRVRGERGANQNSRYGHLALGPGGGKPTKYGDGTKVFPPPVKGGQKYAAASTEPSPSPVDNRAFGGKVGGGGKKGKKGGTHVNIMIAPQHGAPGAAGAAPVSALPTPPIMPPKPPMGGPPPGMPPGGPPMGGAPPGGLPALPPGAAPPGAMPPGLAPKPPMMPPRKRGGRVMAKHKDADADAAQIKHMVRKSALKPHGSMRAAGGGVPMMGARAHGGRIGLTAGAYSGEGRLEKTRSIKKVTHAHPQKV